MIGSSSIPWLVESSWTLKTEQLLGRQPNISNVFFSFILLSYLVIIFF